MEKWWSSGAGDLRCKVYIVFGKTDPTNKDLYRQQSVMIVPADTSGITVKRVLSVVGYDHAPEGHAHISFQNVHVPKTDVVLGEGRGFEIVQGRLGPGRIHHAMRSIGAVSCPWFASKPVLMILLCRPRKHSNGHLPASAIAAGPHLESHFLNMG